MKAFKTLLILSHRYIGIPLSFMFVLWFVSAFFMIYTGGMPRITPDMQVDGASAVDFSRVNLTPAQAAEVAGLEPGAASLRTVLGRPVYQLSTRGGDTYVYADDGSYLDFLTEAQGAQLASDFLDIPVEQFSFVGMLEDVDQWTMTSSRNLPFYKYTVNDELGTEVYVAPQSATVNVYTTTQSRALAWLGTIPHWLYFESLRLNQPLWYDIVVWSSTIGCVMAFLGLCLGVTQFRKVRPFDLKRAIPYRGMMRWHYILGVVFGVFSLTWVFSGLLSMEPYAWSNSRGVSVDPGVYTGGELDLAAFPSPRNYNWDTLVEGEVKDVEFRWIQGAPYMLASYGMPREAGSVKRDRLHQPYNINGQFSATSVLVAANGGQIVEGFDQNELVAKLDASIEDAAVETTLLTDYDNYYYSRGNQLPLPVLRVKFDDPLQSWIYVDPEKSELLTVIDKWSRLERWLYNGLHSLDFAFWYHKRPLWDIGVILLLAGGLATSLIGLYFGLRRLKFDIVNLVNRLRKTSVVEEPSHASP